MLYLCHGIISVILTEAQPSLPLGLSRAVIFKACPETPKSVPFSAFIAEDIGVIFYSCRPFIGRPALQFFD